MGPPTANLAIPLNLNLSGALAWQHQERHLHLGLVGLQWEVSLGEHPGGGLEALLFQMFLEAFRNLKTSDCRQRHRQECQGLRPEPNTPQDKVLGTGYERPGAREAQSLPVAGSGDKKPDLAPGTQGRARASRGCVLVLLFLMWMGMQSRQASPPHPTVDGRSTPQPLDLYSVSIFWATDVCETVQPKRLDPQLTTQMHIHVIFPEPLLGLHRPHEVRGH